MGTTRQDINKWFDEGVKKKATHMIVVCNTFSHEDYPVYVKKTEKVQEIYEKYGKDMQRVMEVYSLSKPKMAQLNEKRAFNFD